MIIIRSIFLGQLFLIMDLEEADVHQELIETVQLVEYTTTIAL